MPPEELGRRHFRELAGKALHSIGTCGSLVHQVLLSAHHLSCAPHVSKCTGHGIMLRMHFGVVLLTFINSVCFAQKGRPRRGGACRV